MFTTKIGKKEKKRRMLVQQSYRVNKIRLKNKRQSLPRPRSTISSENNLRATRVKQIVDILLSVANFVAIAD